MIFQVIAYLLLAAYALFIVGIVYHLDDVDGFAPAVLFGIVITWIAVIMAHSVGWL